MCSTLLIVAKGCNRVSVYKAILAGKAQSGLASITWMDTALNSVKMNMGDMGAQ